MQNAITGLLGALGVESAGVSADAAWHTVWHHTMQGEGLFHPWPHALIAAGFSLTWAAALHLLWSTRHSPAAGLAKLPRMRSERVRGPRR